MTWLCPRPCENKTADGYCGTSWCINPMYSNIGTANEKLMGGLRKTTNADRIRAKSVEEMAEWIMSIEPAACPFRDDHGDNCRFSHCKDCWVDWLRQEATE